MGKSSRGCFKQGCFGCLGVAALTIFVFIGLAALQSAARNTPPEPVSVEHVHNLGGGAGGAAPSDALPLEAEGTLPDGTQLGEVLPLPKTLVAPEPRPGRLVLDIGYGSFELRPGEPGEPLRVEADYDSRSFELEETFTEESDGTWSYDVRFGNKGGFLGLIMGSQGNANNHVIITLPPDHPVDIIGEVGVGEFDADLGGLWIPEIDLEMSAGEQTLRFDEPTREPMERLEVIGSVGELCLETLGNASPREVKVTHSVGDRHLDLRGAWRNDSDIKASFSIGEIRIDMPETARVEVGRQDISLGEVNKWEMKELPDLPEDAPVLKLDVQGSIGSIVLK